MFFISFFLPQLPEETVTLNTAATGGDFPPPGKHGEKVICAFGSFFKFSLCYFSLLKTNADKGERDALSRHKQKLLVPSNLKHPRDYEHSPEGRRNEPLIEPLRENVFEIYCMSIDLYILLN